MLRVLLDYKFNNIESGENNSPLLMVFFIKTIFFYFLFIPLNYSQGTPVLNVAVLDTGFCPSLVYKNPNIVINPVIDVTQSNHYKCLKGKLESSRFHGQRVLDVISFNYTKTKDAIRVIITPVVIFNKYGSQEISYWNQALNLSQEHDLIISAAGLPLPTNETMRKKLLKSALLPKTLTLLASGRIAPGVTKETVLFPQLFHATENIKLIGSYHQPFFKNSSAQEDRSLLYNEGISFYFPYSGEFQPLLRGASRALALGAARIISNCSKVLMKKKSKRISKCLDLNKEKISFKDQKSMKYTLKR